jgi:hypothetical protein
MASVPSPILRIAPNTPSSESANWDDIVFLSNYGKQGLTGGTGSA